jgi:hypothetical protein
VVADDWGSSKHCVQAPDEPKNLLWLVVGKDSKSDFDRHTFFSEGYEKIRADQTCRCVITQLFSEGTTQTWPVMATLI